MYFKTFHYDFYSGGKSHRSTGLGLRASREMHCHILKADCFMRETKNVGSNEINSPWKAIYLFIFGNKNSFFFFLNFFRHTKLAAVMSWMA